MRSRRWLNLAIVVLFGLTAWAQSTSRPPSTGSSAGHSSSASAQKPAADSGIDAGSVVNGVYRNKGLGLTYKIPAGWVLRTEEMNLREDAERKNSESSPQG